MQAAPTSKCIYTPAPMGLAIALYYFIPLAIRPRAYEYVKKTLRAIYVTAHEGLPSLVDEFCVTHTISLDACAAHAVMGPRAIAPPTCYEAQGLGPTPSLDS